MSVCLSVLQFLPSDVLSNRWRRSSQGTSRSRWWRGCRVHAPHYSKARSNSAMLARAAAAPLNPHRRAICTAVLDKCCLVQREATIRAVISSLPNRTLPYLTYPTVDRIMPLPRPRTGKTYTSTNRIFEQHTDTRFAYREQRLVILLPVH